ncbi:MAG: hypothetical protein PHW34_14935 [Hespellia sp.]|nr:hypothetical protein [Hespellia sp.]
MSILWNEWIYVKSFRLAELFVLGSSITAFGLTLWLYEKTGSSLSTAALTDPFDKKKTMLVCDTLVAMCTLFVFVLYKTNSVVVHRTNHRMHFGSNYECKYGCYFKKDYTSETAGKGLSVSTR